MMARSSAIALLLFSIAATNGVSQNRDSGSIQTVNDGGQTIVYIAPIFVAEGVTLSAAYAHPAGSPSTPSTVQLSFATGRRGPDFRASRSLTLLLDQQTELQIGMMEYDARNNMVRRFVPLETFRQIAEAGRVSGQVGPAAFEIPPNVQATLRQLLARMGAAPAATQGKP